MSGQTITEKILAAHAGKKTVSTGEFIEPKVDVALANDITAPLAIKQFSNIFPSGGKVFDRKKVVLVLDHFTPNKDINSAEQCRFVRAFAREQKIVNFFDGGNVGIEHALLPEQKLVLPGDLIIGADSHTCTYGALGAFSTGVGSTDVAAVWASGRIWLKVPPAIKLVYSGAPGKWVYGKDLILYAIGRIGVDGANYRSLEYSGEAIRKLPMPERFTMSNMAIEAGAKNGIVEPDDITLKFVGKAPRKFRMYDSDSGAKYENIIDFDCKAISPQVAMPHLPSNTKPAEELSGVSIDQAVIGSCTNGWLEDLVIAAKILKGRKVNPNVRLLIFPATPRIYREALKKGLMEIFAASGGIVCPPTCGPCLGGHLGVLAEGERSIATTNRNFVGRMGHLKSEVYLSNPAVAAASAIKGRIAHPKEVIR
jgi:3-isopropylmalate/(R)-2-methylmalate dehydratase large subunit